MDEGDIAGFFCCGKERGIRVGLVHFVIRSGRNGSYQFFIAVGSACAAMLCAGARRNDAVADRRGVSRADFC